MLLITPPPVAVRAGHRLSTPGAACQPAAMGRREPARAARGRPGPHSNGGHRTRHRIPRGPEYLGAPMTRAWSHRRRRRVDHRCGHRARSTDDLGGKRCGHGDGRGRSRPVGHLPPCLRARSTRRGPRGCRDPRLLLGRQHDRVRRRDRVPDERDQPLVRPRVHHARRLGRGPLPAGAPLPPRWRALARRRRPAHRVTDRRGHLHEPRRASDRRPRPHDRGPAR